jgi:chemotaxis protein histidine kinase CheA
LIDRAAQLRILVESTRRALDTITSALEEFDVGLGNRGTYSTLQRAFHTIKSDAKHVKLGKLAAVAATCEAIIENASDRKLGLPLDLLRSAADEIQNAIGAIAKGDRHQLDKALMEKLVETAAAATLD